MRLQEVLKEREAEISLLEESLKENQQEKLPIDGAEIPEHETGGVNGIPTVSPETALSPKTLHQFDNIRKTMENGVDGHAPLTDTGSSFSEDESLDRLNELMLYVRFLFGMLVCSQFVLAPWPRRSLIIGKLSNP